MQSQSIVPNLNVFKDDLGCLCSCLESLGDTFGFECRKETFDHGIILIIANPTHTDLNGMVFEQRYKVATGILTTLIAVMHQAIAWVTSPNCHHKSIFNQWLL